MSMIILFGGMMVIFYFFMILPQMRRQKKEKAFREGLKKDDKVVTVGGIYGRIVGVDEGYFMLEIDNNVKVKVDKSAVRAEGTPPPK